MPCFLFTLNFETHTIAACNGQTCSQGNRYFVENIGFAIKLATFSVDTGGPSVSESLDDKNQDEKEETIELFDYENASWSALLTFTSKPYSKAYCKLCVEILKRGYLM